ncbi:TIGR00730 family Rossman fold protein [Wenzhouxiangella sp. C33]|uniref:Cytokinin riboside 5'-monophosphate phosphoribohydrolase n=2 Tax=Wenzhouxiangella limi TaxID=2707351 RepID=A0A845VF72_9GAMM|nr:TIGR00730 family Rossman fold protein [Wenzhouxiangella limi]
MSIQRVTVYAASSQALCADYINAASRLGRSLGNAGLTIIYGGGGHGLMGAMAEGALSVGAEVHGIIPEFLTRVEAGHQALTSLEIVDDMRTRKARMLERSDAVVALPGGCGTFEELFEAMTLKRLGQFLGPIVLVNTGGYYDRLLAFLQQSVDERFMNQAHLQMWQSVEEPEQVLDALGEAPAWSTNAISGAAVVRSAS